MADAARYKVPAVTLIGMTRGLIAPYWHQQADTYDKMEPSVMQRTWDLTKALIERMDA